MNSRKSGAPLFAFVLLVALTRGFDIMIPAQAGAQWGPFAMPAERMTVIQGKTMLVVGLGGPALKSPDAHMLW